MFLSRRATQAEFYDAPGRPPSDIACFYESLGSVNRLFLFGEPFQRLLPKLLGREKSRALSFLDLGAGDGSLGASLNRWATAKRGWDWRFTNLDMSLPALRLAQSGQNVAGAVTALPFRDASFDVVIASQMTHHLEDEGVIRHLREAWRVARKAIFFTDLHRGPALYSLLWVVLHLHRFERNFLADGLLSVKRGFRVGELQTLAKNAGITTARTSLYFGTRVILEARK
jgi:2-polyprenyl-3-methyl-5-hydroxy-6-metoxy-1,4-benzoquinol methylase